MRYRFGAVELDVAAYTLRRDGREVAVQPKIFDVLRYLIEHRERVVSRDELLAALWPGEHVGKAVVAWTVSHIRDALGQGRGQKEPIETIPRRGYRFRGTVEVLAPAPPSRPQVLRVEAPAQLVAAPPPARPFVARGEVMDWLEGLLKDALAGHGHLCLLHGEAGIGKTRCMEELTQIALRAGLATCAGRAVEGAGAPVFWPWIQILRAAIQARPELRESGAALLLRMTAAGARGSLLAAR